jgi:hypothetical protein
MNKSQVLVSYMPKYSNARHLFLSSKKFKDQIVIEADPIWFKKNVNLGESTIQTFFHDMAIRVGLKGNYTNKSSRVINIT